MKKILITGAHGFIGQAVVECLCARYKVISFDREISVTKNPKNISIRGDITDSGMVQQVCDIHVPDVVVHCVGIAHQNFKNSIGPKIYDKINHVATINLAEAAVKANPSIHFIFLSTISVYGKTHHYEEIREDDMCFPFTAYAQSKLDAEQGLRSLFNDALMNKLDILRLVPVYDSTRSLNLDKRVWGPKKKVYVRFGSGRQKMSLLSRQNLVDFILFRIDNSSKHKSCSVFNVTDREPSSFNEIINTFKASEYQPTGRTVKVPLWFVWMLTRIAGLIVKDKMPLALSFYDKLAKDSVFNNKKMLNTGFKPKYTFNSVFLK